MIKRLRLSLANKCQLLFGAAVILILTAALSVVSARMQTLVEHDPRLRAEDLADAWLSEDVAATWLTDPLRPGGALTSLSRALAADAPSAEPEIIVIDRADFPQVSEQDQFLAGAIERFRSRPTAADALQRAEDAQGEVFYRYVRAIRKSDLVRLGSGGMNGHGGLEPEVDTTDLANPLEMMLLIRLRGRETTAEMMVNRIYLVAAGLFAGLLAIAVFWFITMRLILSPVRVLRDVAAKVSAGDWNTRSDINTGDEFEELSDAFNEMLANQKQKQDQLRSINKSLDIKLDELAAANVSLYEADKMKGEFLANVSHELRTPLNSMIGFAEVLGETLEDRGDPLDEKRKRYVRNIIHSSRRLLDLINDLLDLAKIEAGRTELNVTTISIADTFEGLTNLIRPQAEQRRIELQVHFSPAGPDSPEPVKLVDGSEASGKGLVPETRGRSGGGGRSAAAMPVVRTDAGKLHQILFNFLSNAVKFTPEGGTVALAASTARDERGEPCVRLSVSDTGPGIASEDHDRIFDKFTQLDPSVTRSAGGTGLGLTISRELASMLQGTIELDSDLGRGATFTLTIPLVLQRRTAPLMPL